MTTEVREGEQEVTYDDTAIARTPASMRLFILTAIASTLEADVGNRADGVRTLI